MIINFNSAPLETKVDTLASLLEEKELINKSGIAVAVNNEVIQKSGWIEKKLKENDSIMVITATQGG